MLAWSSEIPLFPPEETWTFHAVATQVKGKGHPPRGQTKSHLSPLWALNFPILLKKRPKTEALVSVPRVRPVRSTHVGDNDLLFYMSKHTRTPCLYFQPCTYVAFLYWVFGSNSGRIKLWDWGKKKKKRPFFFPSISWSTERPRFTFDLCGLTRKRISTTQAVAVHLQCAHSGCCMFLWWFILFLCPDIIKEEKCTKKKK